jgi:hypothetical protein
MIVEDFVARRRAAIQTEREQYAEWKLEDELEHDLKSLRYEFEALMEREREKRRKYWGAMVQKRAATSRQDPAK